MRLFKEPLKPEEEKYYLELLRHGDKNARDILVERNLRLVAHVVKKYSHEDRDLEDLLSIGTIGLIKAINTFRPEKGNKLATYAAKCIDNELLMMLRSEKKKNREVSLNEPIGVDKEGNSINLIDVIEFKGEDVSALVETNEDIERVKEYVKTKLNEREREIIIQRYGLNGEEPKTQKVLGEELGISRSYVSRIEKKALEKLKESFDIT